jgi:branched-chain amino acid transport system permease protein
MALQYIVQFFFGGGPLRIVTATPTAVDLGPVSLTRQTLISVVIAVVTLAAVAYFLLATRAGQATRAVSDNPALAAASGITVDRVIRLVWTLGAGLAGLGGVLLGLYLGATRWNTGGALLLLMFAAVTLGGLGAAFGALAGSIVIGLVVELSSLWIPSDMRYGAALVILILVLLLRPQGILGRATRIG